MIIEKSRVSKGGTRFEAVALPHMGYLYRSAYWLTGNRMAAEDLTQETMMVAMQKIDQLKDVSRCRSWLFVILRNLFLGKLEKNRGRIFLDFEKVADGLVDESHKARELMREGFSDETQHQLNRLEAKYKTPLVMSVLGEYSYREIAAELDIPIGTVMSRIARGKAFLRYHILKKTQTKVRFPTTKGRIGAV